MQVIHYITAFNGILADAASVRNKVLSVMEASGCSLSRMSFYLGAPFTTEGPGQVKGALPTPQPHTEELTLCHYSNPTNSATGKGPQGEG